MSKKLFLISHKYSVHVERKEHIVGNVTISDGNLLDSAVSHVIYRMQTGKTSAHAQHVYGQVLTYIPTYICQIPLHFQLKIQAKTLNTTTNSIQGL